MDWLWILAGAVLLLGAAFVGILLYCYIRTFYVSRKPQPKPEYDLPPGKIYVPYHELMKGWIRELRDIPYTEVNITSFDGLPLYAKYYEFAPGAVTEIMFHGYRGNADRDLCGGVQRCFALGRNALIVDQRASGKSGGHTITFGINESRDCLSWVAFARERFGETTPLLLTGISMGASTVLIAAGNELPDNVVGVLADCGFSSAREIIQKIIRDLKLPPRLMYPFVKLAAKWFGRFDLEETSAVEAMARCRVPVLFFHGEDDRFVPCEMSRQSYDACTAPKRLVTVPCAGHGLCYPIDQAAYLREVSDFFTAVGVPTTCDNKKVFR